MGMSVLSTVPTPQSIGEAGEKMIPTEGRRIQTTAGSVAKGNKEKMFSLSVQSRVYPLGMCQVWVLVASMLL